MGGMITIERFEVSPEVFGGGDGPREPVRPNQFIAEFTVRVTETGCYAIKVTLEEEGALWDNPIAIDPSTRLDCYCIESGGAGKSFSITTGAAPSNGHDPLKPGKKGATALKPLHGSWPDGDDLGQEIEVALKVEVFQCRKGCTGGKGCETISKRNLGEAYIELESEELEVEILDSPGVIENTWPFIKEAGSAAAGAALSHAQGAPGEQEENLLALASAIKGLDRKVSRINRNMNRTLSMKFK